MHDLKFANDILLALKKSGVDRSKNVIVRILLSPFTHVTPEGLTETARYILGHEGFKNTSLDIKPLPYKLVCKKCKKTTEHNKPVFSCPECSSEDFDIIKESEFRIEGIDI